MVLKKPNTTTTDAKAKVTITHKKRRDLSQVGPPGITSTLGTGAYSYSHEALMEHSDTWQSLWCL